MLRGTGWAITTFPTTGWARGMFESYLEKDPRGAGKMHARDVIEFRREEALAGAVSEITASPSIAFVTEQGNVIDDFSRMPMATFGQTLIRALLRLIPQEDLPMKGRMSADYFRYSAGLSLGPHQDKFGRWVMIWCLSNDSAQGGESTLEALDGSPVLRGQLQPGDLLVFDDEKFRHGLTTTQAGRDVIIFITLK